MTYLFQMSTKQKSILSKLRELRAGQAKPVTLPEPTTEAVDIQKLKDVVAKDVGLKPAERDTLIHALSDPGFIYDLKTGSLGTAVSHLLARFLKMPAKTQLLLSIAGFGIGKMIYDHRHATQGGFSQYNQKSKMYEIRDN